MISGQAVDVHYDPMLAKIVAKGRTREEARRRLVAALRETVALGVATNVSWLGRLLESGPVVRGETHTGLARDARICRRLRLPTRCSRRRRRFSPARLPRLRRRHEERRWPGPFDTPFRMGSGA